MGVYSPYGLPWNGPIKPLGRRPAKAGEINYIRANPVIAWQPCDTLSIAAGSMLDYSQAELKTSAPGFSLRGRDTDAGFDTAILWHPVGSAFLRPDLSQRHRHELQWPRFSFSGRPSIPAAG